MLLTITTRRSAGSIGTNRLDRSRQSISMAVPARPLATIVWSMMPHGVSPYTCSAVWLSRASCWPSMSRPAMASNARPVPTSRAALLLRPPPMGSVLVSRASMPARPVSPAAISSAAMPRE